MKELIHFNLTIHVETWILRCPLIAEPKYTLLKNTFIYLEKQSLLLRLNASIRKRKFLLATKQQWFDHYKSEYIKIPVITLKQWIRNTKILFKKEKFYKIDSRKTTDFHKKEKEGTNNIFRNNIISIDTRTIDNNHILYNNDRQYANVPNNNTNTDYVFGRTKNYTRSNNTEILKNISTRTVGKIISTIRKFSYTPII